LRTEVIDKFLGDGVMAAFGQPKSTADDAARALECAVHLSGMLHDSSEMRRRRCDVNPRAGIGLHFGTAIGGVLRSGSHDEFTLVGDAVNVAQRLERLCKPLDASIVASWEVVEAGDGRELTDWKYENGVEIEGRSRRMRIAYIPNELGRVTGELIQQGIGR
jgi:adenylate cyclase